MSKIYEALLRAEQDRAIQQAEQPENSSKDADATPAPLPAAPVTQEEAYAPDSRMAPALSPGLRAPVPVQVSVEVWQPLYAELPALQARGSKIEQFRSLRSKLFGLHELHPIKSIYIGSGRPNEGKSFVATNAAIILARHKSARVLLIDGDMRKGSLHKVLGSPHHSGLAEFLSGNAGLEEVLQRGVANDAQDPLPPGLASLTFCAAGNAGNRAAELSGSQRFPELIKTLAPQFDWIIVDSSPVNLVSDGVNLARACDGALLIVRGGVTKFKTAQLALQELKSTKVLGVVLNAVEENLAPDGYYGYNSYDSSEEQVASSGHNE